MTCHGHCHLTGGDWDLEVKTGAIETRGIKAADYQQVLEGTFLWAKGITNGVITPRNAVIDTAGNIYTVGIYSGTVEFSPGNPSGTISRTGLDAEAFISKHNADGSFAWVKKVTQTVGSPGGMDSGIAVSASGEVYFSVPYAGDATFEGINIPGNGTSASSSILGKLNPDGSVGWVKRFAGNAAFAVDDVKVDASGSVYFGGWFSGTADFDPDAGIANRTSAGSDEAYVAKLNADGSFAWAKQLGSNATEQIDGIAVDTAGNVYSTGWFAGAFTANTVNGPQTLISQGEFDSFINKFDANGNLLWINQIGGANTELSSDIAVDLSGNAYVVTDFNSATLQVGSSSFANQGGNDALISKFDANGQFVWGREIAGNGNDRAKSIAVGSAGQVYVTGWFSNSTSFNVGGITQTFTSQGADDIFVAGLGPTGNFTWANQIGGSGGLDRGFSISVNNAGNILLAGEFQNEINFGAGSGIPNLTTAPGSLAMFISRLSDVTNLAPTDLAFSGLDNIIAENADLTQRRKVANIQIFDDGIGTNTLALTGADAAKFEIDNNVLYLKAGTVLSYETQPTYDVSVTVDDATIGNTPDRTQSLTITVADVDPILNVSSSGNGNEAGPINSGFVIALNEPSNVPLTVNYSLAGTALAGTDYTLLVGNGISNVTNTSFTIDAGITTATLTVQVNDDAISEPDETVILNLAATPSYTLGTASANLNIITNDQNLAPTGITLTNQQNIFAENSDSSQRRKVADIVVADDGFGINTLSLGGADATNFEIDNNVLYLKAGVALSFETKPQYDVSVSVDDTTIGNTPDATTAITVSVADVDPVLTVSSGINANEAGTTDGTFTLALSEASATPIVVTYNLNGTATEGTDYTIVAGTGISNVTATTFTLDAGITSATINVKPVDDAVIDLNETVQLSLLNGSAYIVGNPGVLFAATSQGRVTVGDGEFSPAVGDLNKDGNLDFVIANLSNDTLSINFGDGTGNFPNSVNQAVGDGPFSVKLGDINKDGNLDILTANLNSNDVSVLLGDGAGGFSAIANVTAGNQPHSIELADVNLDGNLDFLVANAASNDVSIRLGDGAGNFSALTPSVPVGVEPDWITIADVNGDGKLDFLTANTRSNDISIRFGDGIGGFSGATSVNVGAGPLSIALGDINEDGDLDLLASNVFSNTISVRLGDGSGNFIGTTEIATGGYPDPVVLADVNGDGHLDFLTTNTTADTVSVYMGNGQGQFSSATAISAGAGPNGIALADLNKDGQLDLLVMNSNSNDVSVLLNQTGNLITILDNDPSINITAGITPVEDTDTNGSFNIALNAASPAPITVNYSLAGTATLGDDYTITAGNGISNVTATSFTIDAGITAATLNLVVVNDPLQEPDETVAITLSIDPIPGNAASLVSNTASLTIGASDPNQAPTAISFNNTQLAIAENADVTQRIKVADIVITDDGQGVNNLSLGGADAANFEIDGTAVYLKANTILSYETKPQYDLAVIVDDPTVGTTPDQTQSLTIAVTDVDPTITITPGTTGNEAGPINGNFNITLDQASTTPLTVAYNLGGTATAGDDYTIVAGNGISNVTATSFTIAAGVTSATLNVNVIDDTVAEPDETIELTLTAGDAYGLTAPVTTLSIVTNDANQAPTALALNDLVLSLAENADTTQPIKVAKILIVDDGVGTNTLSLTGADAASFEIIGNFLYLKAGAVLSYEAKAKYDIAINVDDATIGNTPDATEAFSLAILDVAPLPPVLPGSPDGPEANATRIMKRDRVTQEVTVRITTADGLSTTQAVTYGATFADQAGQTVKLEEKWRILDTADLDNDGIEDILFQNAADDEIGIWYLGEGGSIKSLDYLRDTDGSILRTGRTDWTAIGLSTAAPGQLKQLIWRNSVTDEIAFWSLNSGSNVVGSYDFLRNADASIMKTQSNNWKIVGLGNFDGTAGSEIVMHRQDTNETAILQTQGNQLQRFYPIDSYPDANWTIQGVSDRDRDGNSEIVWRNGAQTMMQKVITAPGTIIATAFEAVTISEADSLDFVTDLNLEDNLG
jgi:FG-GAP-like repeat/Beta-propeller repeat/Calx-beta domain